MGGELASLTDEELRQLLALRCKSVHRKPLGDTTQCTRLVGHAWDGVKEVHEWTNSQGHVVKW